MQKKSFDKKGAIELSMTTIIVIIIGITLLSLGLIWVRGVFKDIDKTTRTAFDQADGAIDDIFEEVDEVISVSPPSLELEQNQATDAKFIITNLEEDTITIKAKVSSSDKKLECLFADTLKKESKEYKLNSGQQVKIKVLIKENGSNLGPKVCDFSVPSLSGDNSEQMIITVVKS